MGIQYRKDICTCHDEFNLIVKRLPGRKLCYTGNEARKKEAKEARDLTSGQVMTSRSKLQRKRQYFYKSRATGEKVLFEIIWGARPHISFLNGESLGEDAYAWMFAHVLRKAKGHYPEFKLYDRNVILLTKEQHDLYDSYVRNPEYLISLDSRWAKVFTLRKELLVEYTDQFGPE